VVSKKGKKGENLTSSYRNKPNSPKQVLVTNLGEEKNFQKFRA